MKVSDKKKIEFADELKAMLVNEYPCTKCDSIPYKDGKDCICSRLEKWSNRQNLLKQAKNYTGDKLSFVDGAEWMEAKMIEKACDCFKKVLISNFAMTKSTFDDIYHQFKIAMEE